MNRKKLLAVAGLAVAPLIGGGAAMAAAAPAVAAPAHTSHAAAKGNTQVRAPGERQTEKDGPGGHQDPNGVNVNHQNQGNE